MSQTYLVSEILSSNCGKEISFDRVTPNDCSVAIHVHNTDGVLVFRLYAEDEFFDELVETNFRSELSDLDADDETINQHIEDLVDAYTYK